MGMATDPYMFVTGNPNTFNRHWSLRKCSPPIHALDASTMAFPMLLKAYLGLCLDKYQSDIDWYRFPFNLALFTTPVDNSPPPTFLHLRIQPQNLRMDNTTCLVPSLGLRTA